MCVSEWLTQRAESDWVLIAANDGSARAATADQRVRHNESIRAVNVCVLGDERKSIAAVAAMSTDEQRQSAATVHQQHSDVNGKTISMQHSPGDATTPHAATIADTPQQCTAYGRTALLPAIR